MKDKINRKLKRDRENVFYKIFKRHFQETDHQESKMKAYKVISTIIVATIILTGCKVTVSTEVSLKDILYGETRTITGDLHVEVAGCSSHEDSRKPSASIQKAQQTIPSIFADAEYLECFSQGFKSFAHFKVPFFLDKDKDGKLASEKHINILSNKDTLLWVGIPTAIKENLERARSNSYGSNALDLSINIKVNNDTGKDFPFAVVASYVDGKPYVFGNLTSTKGKGPFVVTLSDVSVSDALENGVAMVLNWDFPEVEQ